MLKNVMDFIYQHCDHHMILIKNTSSFLLLSHDINFNA
jgi:hypothetical protein